MNWTFELDLGSVKIHQNAKYLDHRSLKPTSKVIIRTQAHFL